MKIILNEAEQRLVTYIAKRRFITKREAGIPISKIGPQSLEDTDKEGFGGEVAYCRYMNIYPDLTIGTDVPDFDCILPSGERIDVKTTKYRNGHLIATTNKIKHPPDIYVLVIGTFPEYSIIGEISASFLLRPENIKDFGMGDTYAVTQSELKPCHPLQ